MVKELVVDLFFLGLFSQLPFILAGILCEGGTHSTWADSIRQGNP
jgi:hypothetical protein